MTEDRIKCLRCFCEWAHVLNESHDLRASTKDIVAQAIKDDSPIGALIKVGGKKIEKRWLDFSQGWVYHQNEIKKTSI